MQSRFVDNKLSKNSSTIAQMVSASAVAIVCGTAAMVGVAMPVGATGPSSSWTPPVSECQYYTSSNPIVQVFELTSAAPSVIIKNKHSVIMGGYESSKRCWW